MYAAIHVIIAVPCSANIVSLKDKATLNESASTMEDLLK